MKKSVEIIGLPIISITEGRELGMSKSLLIDAKNDKVAAITIEDQDWYRGVKLLPYESVIAIGEDAVTITSSDSILTLEDAGDYENMLDDNIRVIGTKAITRSGTIEGCVSEIFVGDNGKIEKCEITKKDDSKDEVTSNQISIFGKQVTVIDPDNEEKKTVIPEQPVQQQAPAQPAAPQEPAAKPQAPAPQAHDHAAEEKEAAEKKAAEEKAEAEKEAAEEKAAEEKAKAEKEAAEKKAAEEKAKAEKEAAEKKAAEEKAKAEKEAAEKKAAEEKAKAAAKPEQKQPAGHAPADKAAEDRRRRFLLGKKAARRITTDNGIVIVEAGADITEEVLQKAKLANKFIELSMNIQ